MINNKKIFIPTIIVCSSLSLSAYASDQYPNISGKALFELRTDRVISTDKSNVNANDAKVNVDADFNFNLNKNWEIMTGWRFRPVDRDRSNPERYRTILSDNRDVGLNGEGLIVEQLKIQYKNDDAKMFLGKFNPIFGSAHRKEKRMGVFTTDFTKDYELREKIGAGFSIILDNAEINAATFFNDTTGLSDSAIEQRGKESRSDGIAGNTSSPSSHAISVDGQDLFGVRDLFYNLGYRKLKVGKLTDRSNETGFVGGLEYLLPINSQTSFIPFVEVASIKNLSGERNRDALYSTIAFVVKYSGWRFSVSNVTRDIDRGVISDRQKDQQMQYSIGYKFDNNISIDLSESAIKEDGNKASLIGLIVSYAYNF